MEGNQYDDSWDTDSVARAKPQESPQNHLIWNLRIRLLTSYLELDYLSGLRTNIRD